MDSCDLTNKKCKPCEGGVEPLTEAQSRALLESLKGWELTGKRIEKLYKFKDFVEAMVFVNKLVEVAESEGHHPDLHIQNYNEVRVELWTHAIGGLSENDFIVAAKSDAVL